MIPGLVAADVLLTTSYQDNLFAVGKNVIKLTFHCRGSLHSKSTTARVVMGITTLTPGGKKGKRPETCLTGGEIQPTALPDLVLANKGQWSDNYVPLSVETIPDRLDL